MANETKTIIDILAAFGEQLVVDTKANIQKYQHGALNGQQSGLLGDNPFTVYQNEDGTTFEFRLADYADFVDGGTRPAKKRTGAGAQMIESLNAWQVGKGINAEQIYRSKLKNPNKSKITYNKAQKSLSYAIKKNIHKKGIIKRFGYKGSKFFSSLLEDGRIERLAQDISVLVGREVIINIKDGIIKGKA